MVLGARCVTMFVDRGKMLNDGKVQLLNKRLIKEREECLWKEIRTIVSLKSIKNMMKNEQKGSKFGTKTEQKVVVDIAIYNRNCCEPLVDLGGFWLGLEVSHIR